MRGEAVLLPIASNEQSTVGWVIRPTCLVYEYGEVEADEQVGWQPTLQGPDPRPSTELISGTISNRA